MADGKVELFAAKGELAADQQPTVNLGAPNYMVRYVVKDEVDGKVVGRGSFTTTDTSGHIGRAWSIAGATYGAGIKVEIESVVLMKDGLAFSEDQHPALFADVGQQERVQRQEKEIEATEDDPPAETCDTAKPKKMEAKKDVRLSAASTLAAMATPASEPVELAIHVEGEDQYEFTWGHRPRGTGSWAFEIGGKTEFIPGLLTYTEAKKAAAKIAEERGVSTIKVLT